MKHWHLVAYDVTSPKRLRRVHRHLSARALAVQRSVFLFHGSRRELRQILSELDSLVDEKDDDVRVYPSIHPARMWLSRALQDSAPDSQPDGEPPLLISHDGEINGGIWHNLARRLRFTA